MRIHWMISILAFALAGLRDAAADMTSSTALASSRATSASATRTVGMDELFTVPLRREKRPWGEMIVVALRSAPFPDDSRTTGIVRGGKVFEYKGHYDDPSVAICIPNGFRASARPDFILHFHGNTDECTSAVARQELGEQLLASGKNAIVIAPQGPKNSPDSTIGKLERKNGFGNMMEDVLGVLKQQKVLPAEAQFGRIILGGHSGGYRPIGKVLAMGDLADHIQEIWLWDAAYGEWDHYAEFMVGDLAAAIRAHKPSPLMPGRQLRSIFTDHLMASNVRIMSLLTLSGVPIAMVHEDDITTAPPSADGKLPPEAAPVTDGAPVRPNLENLLRGNFALFLHTRLTHGQVVAKNRYFERWARESPNLDKR